MLSMNIFDNRRESPPSQSAQSLYDSSYSSGRKRKRDGSESPTRSRFTDACKNMVKRRCDTEQCWNCEAPGAAEFRHVVGQAGPTFSFITQTTGMNPFREPGDYRNVVVLCPSCHANSGWGGCARWTFLPTSLQFFVDYEKRDFEARLRRWRSAGSITDRKHPDEQEYEEYCRTVVALDPDDGLCRGGVYDRLVLQAIFPTKVMAAYGLEKLPGRMFGESKRWHGAPMASIVKGMSCMGVMIRILPEDVSNKLRELQKLYTRDLQNELGAVETPVSDRPQDGQSIADGGPSGGASIRSTHYVQSSAHSHSQSQLQLLPQERRDSRQDERREDRCSDSAIDMRRFSHTGKRKQEADSGSTGDRAHSLRRKKRRRDSIGIDRDTWCFGPSSCSDDKMHGRYWYSGEVG